MECSRRDIRDGLPQRGYWSLLYLPIHFCNIPSGDLDHETGSWKKPSESRGGYILAIYLLHSPSLVEGTAQWECGVMAVLRRACGVPCGQDQQEHEVQDMRFN